MRGESLITAARRALRRPPRAVDTQGAGAEGKGLEVGIDNGAMGEADRNPAEARGGDTLEGVLERVIFADPESGWSVVRLALRGRLERATAVGILVGVHPGERLRLTGRWVVDPRYGEQFRVDSFVPVGPDTEQGIERYLASGLIPGIGPVTAKRMVARFGLETLDVISKVPERLCEVEGIGPVRAGRIRAGWEARRGTAEAMVFLQAHGIAAAVAARVVRRYGQRAIAAVREDPYRLALEVSGIGFATADAVAARLGVARDSPRRAQAAVLHVLAQASERGHVFVPREKVVEAAGRLLAAPPGGGAGGAGAAGSAEAASVAATGTRAMVERAVDELASARRLVREPFGSSESLYLPALYEAEAGAAKRLQLLLDTPPAALALDVARAIAWAEGRAGLTLGGEQRGALAAALTAKVVVISGGPGTGKTTLLTLLVRILERKGQRVLLAAPTGRAAKRLAEATGHDARTIHRLLEFSPKEMSFGRNLERPLEADMVVVDEASMLDMGLFFHLLEALPPACRLALVGDVDQLPSVGAGAVLREVIASRAVPVVRLSEIFRQAGQSLIVLNAHRINRGELPKGGGPEASDFMLVECEDPQEVLATLKHLVAEGLPKCFGFDPVRDIQVLTPMHRGPLGATNLNAELQALLNPRGAPAGPGGRALRLGDKVMQVHNNYEREVFNGDLGQVVGVDRERREVVVAFDGRPVRYAYADLDELTLAYACSIHKAQGSEYPAAMIIVHPQHYVLLQRNLLYTAVTRGKRLVVLLGSRRAVAMAVANHRPTARYTRLAERLRGRDAAHQHR